MTPKSVAIIGASDKPDKVGHVIMQNYVDAGYSGRIYPVNVKNDGTIMGLKAYSSVLGIKKPIDLAVIAVPAMAVNQVMEECGRAGVKGAIVVSGGFSEVGDTQLQEQLSAIAKKYSMPTIGPNCLGVMDPRSRIDTLFLPTFKIDRPKIGGVSFAAQSGAVGSAVLDMIGSEGFGLARFISYGNAADVDECDILNYLGNDKDTKVVVYYIEGVKRGREFIEVAKRVTKVKPVVISKGGVTAAGAGAAHSHTASLAGSTQAYEAVFRQFGFAIARDIKDLINYAKVFDTQPLATGKRVAVLTNGGGIGVLTTDALYNNGLEIAKLSKESEDKLKKLMPDTVNITMPLDLVGDADDKRYTDALSVVVDDPNVDAIITIVLFQTPGADSRLATSIVNMAKTMKKPMIGLSIGGSYTHAHKIMMENEGMPVYESPDDAASSLAALIGYSRYRKGIA